METNRLGISLIFCVLSISPLCLVTSRNLAELADQKNYYSPDPNTRSPPRHSHKSPSCQTPSPGGSGTTPSHGGGSHYSPPTTPSHGGGGSSGGGYYNTPPTTPLSPLIPLVPPSPTTPSPLVPLTPPTITIPSPPLIPDPNTPPFTCNYWFTHPTAIWVLFGYWGTISQAFGTPPATSFPLGRNLSLLEALGNTRGDGFGVLLREGTASLLNSMASSRFYFNTQQVREGFNTAMRSEKMAAAQGKIFQKANEGHLKR